MAIRLIAVPTAALALAIASTAIAQPGATSQPDTTKAQPKADPKPDAKPASAPGYPPYLKKNLYASVDVRGKPAPKIQADEWIPKQPDTKGKTVLIDMWATWCAPCRQLIPELEAFQEKFKDDLVVIGITAEKKKQLDNFEDLRGAKVKYTIGRDEKNWMFTEVGCQGLPHVLVISSDGVVRWQGWPQSQEEPLSEATLKQIIDTDKAERAKRGEQKPADPAPAKPGDKPTDPRPVDAKPLEKPTPKP